MDLLLCLLAASTFPHLLVSTDPVELRPVIELVEGDARLFSGESVFLRCSVPGDPRWLFQWFRGDELLLKAQDLRLWRAKIQQSGKYSCQGWQDSPVGIRLTALSLPTEIHVDGGWVILQVPPRTHLVGDNLEVTCRLRGDPPPLLAEVILYRDGLQVLSRRDSNPRLLLANLTLQDQGLYRCRATWDEERISHSAVSVDAELTVLEVLTQPELEVVEMVAGLHDMMKLVCRCQYNAHGAPPPPLHYYFYRDGNRLGPATSENHELYQRSAGQYHCVATVPALDLTRQSDSKDVKAAPGGPRRPG